MTFNLQLLSQQFVKQTVYLPTVDSTNSHALRIAGDASMTTPALVICDEQTSGRGRGENRWWSTAENLAFSLVVDLPISISDERRLWLSPLAGLAICQTLSQLHVYDPFQIKWPNDVLVCGKKISGILIEPVPRCARRWVIGCGINVNASMQSPAAGTAIEQASLPAAARFPAISLFDLTGQRFDLTLVLQRFLLVFETLLEQLASESEEIFRQVQNCCYLSGKWVKVLQANRIAQGRCLGFDPRGALVLLDDQHQRQYIFSGRVESADPLN